MVLLTQSQDEDFALIAEVNNARNISLMIKAIHFKDVSKRLFLIVILYTKLKCYGNFHHSVVFSTT